MKQETLKKLVERSKIEGLDPNFVLAIISVESAGKAFVAKGKPVIQFEGRVFLNYTKNRHKCTYFWRDGALHLYYPTFNIKIVDRVGPQDEEWENFEKACQISKPLAIMSTSWGLPQIMGFNYQKTRCKDVMEFYERMCKNEEEQLMLMLEFLVGNAQLYYAIRNRDIKGFARLYNGPQYAKWGYHIKLANMLEKIEKKGYDFLIDKTKRGRKQTKEGKDGEND